MEGNWTSAGLTRLQVDATMRHQNYRPLKNFWKAASLNGTTPSSASNTNGVCKNNCRKAKKKRDWRNMFSKSRPFWCISSNTETGSLWDISQGSTTNLENNCCTSGRLWKWWSLSWFDRGCFSGLCKSPNSNVAQTLTKSRVIWTDTTYSKT